MMSYGEFDLRIVDLSLGESKNDQNILLPKGNHIFKLKNQPMPNRGLLDMKSHSRFELSIADYP